MTEADEHGDSALKRYRAMGRCYVHFAIENPAYFHILGRPEFYSAGDESFSRGYQEFFDTMSEAAGLGFNLLELFPAFSGVNRRIKCQSITPRASLVFFRKEMRNGFDPADPRSQVEVHRGSPVHV